MTWKGIHGPLALLYHSVLFWTLKKAVWKTGGFTFTGPELKLLILFGPVITGEGGNECILLMLSCCY